MFQLIIAIIAIALVAVLAVASLYYGGSAFSNGSTKAAASTVVSQAQQISAADVLFQNENAGGYAADVAALVSSNYLASAPSMPAKIGSNLEMLSGTAHVFGTVANAEICKAINDQTGFDNSAVTDDGTGTSLASALTTANVQYGCAADNAATPTKWTFAYL